MDICVVNDSKVGLSIHEHRRNLNPARDYKRHSPPHTSHQLQQWITRLTRPDTPVSHVRNPLHLSFNPRVLARPVNVTSTEFRSRRRRQGAFEDLKHQVEELPPAVLQVLLSRVEQPPTTRSYLLQAQIYSVSARIVE